MNGSEFEFFPFAISELFLSAKLGFEDKVVIIIW